MDKKVEDGCSPELEIVDEEANDKKYVARELERVREFLRGITMDDLKGGDWFVKLLASSLHQYTKNVDANYLRNKYPHLPPDGIVDARIKMASNHAGIAGSLTSTAYTGAIAATIGTSGGASPLTLPAAGTSFAIDLAYTSMLQLRMAHDIAVLYNVPLDLTDPEDTWKLVRLAFGIKAGETVGQGAMRGVPAFIRPIVKKNL